MKKICCFILMLGMHVNYATANESNPDARRIADKISTTYENINCKNPGNDVTARACKLSFQKGKCLNLWHVAEDVMFSYMDELQAQMQQIEKSNARKLKHETTGSTDDTITENWWLDRGNMDSDECQWNFDKKRACDYPDGFEDFSVQISDSDPDLTKNQNIQTLSAHIDNAKDNKTYIITVKLYTQLDNNHCSTVVTVDGQEYSYTEYYKWRNQWAADIRNGMMIKTSKKERKQPKNSPFGAIEWRGDNSKQWASQKIPPYKQFGVTIDAYNFDSKGFDNKS